MNKKDFLKTYNTINKMNLSTDAKSDSSSKEPKLYRSEQDEKLIKDMHYAKFQKNLHKTQQSDEFKTLIEKEEWDEQDMQKLLASLR
ncbi:hypothetical protein MSP8887_01974 [Marinomonas spartinae]|uniref:Uncharacterized protein n=1 Tax=Marinomonas spartinae TaxID=1792290 RepID=A0A1A8TGT9_9GAMM|nr:hypothetical protein [Marinomonas spartinae]SBS31494.1 hypothetical protein MSP8886_02138 [Marinomonas spartinae]SBS33616.1 hypothetical protein MSP8887_01974 [Marinomonas spartinae]